MPGKLSFRIRRHSMINAKASNLLASVWPACGNGLSAGMASVTFCSLFCRRFRAVQDTCVLFASRHYMITALLLSKHPRFAAALCLPVFKLLLDCLRDLPEFIQARCLRKRVVATVFELCIQTFPSHRPSDRKPYFEKSLMSL